MVSYLYLNVVPQMLYFQLTCLTCMMNWLSLLAESFLIAVGVVTFLSNLSTIVAFIQQRSLRSNPSYWYLASLAVADGLVGLLAFPATIYDEFHRETYDKRYCDLIAYCTFVTVIPTFAHLTMVSVDRYFKLVSPLKYIKHMNVTRAKVALLVIWCVSLAAAAGFLCSNHTFQDTSCLALKLGDGSESTTSAFAFWTFLVFFQHLPVCLLIYLNLHIYRIASRVKKVAQRELTISHPFQKLELRIHRGKVTLENALSISSNTSTKTGDNLSSNFKSIFCTSSSGLNTVAVPNKFAAEHTVSTPSSPTRRDVRSYVSEPRTFDLSSHGSHLALRGKDSNDVLRKKMRLRKNLAAHNFRVRKLCDWVVFGVKQRKCSILISMIVIAAAILWIPSSTVYMIKWYCEECTWSRETWISYLSPWPIYFSSTVNPFILLFMSEDFRKAYGKLYPFVRRDSRKNSLV